MRERKRRRRRRTFKYQTYSQSFHTDWNSVLLIEAAIALPRAATIHFTHQYQRGEKLKKEKKSCIGKSIPRCILVRRNTDVKCDSTRCHFVIASLGGNLIRCRDAAPMCIRETDHAREQFLLPATRDACENCSRMRFIRTLSL